MTTGLLRYLVRLLSSAKVECNSAMDVASWWTNLAHLRWELMSSRGEVARGGHGLIEVLGLDFR